MTSRTVKNMMKVIAMPAMTLMKWLSRPMLFTKRSTDRSFLLRRNKGKGDI